MPEVITLIIGFILGMAIVYLFLSKRLYSASTTNTIEDHVRKQKSEKQSRKEKILELLRKKENVTNDDVETTLKVSDASATNYLFELEREGKIEQIGARGRFVAYRLK